MNTKQRGFEINLQAPDQIMKIRLWGRWDAAFARRYLHEFEQQIKTLNGQTEPWGILLDLLSYPPQFEEIYTLIGDGLAQLKDSPHGKKCAILVHGSPVHFAFKGSFRDPPIYSYFQSEEDAVRWLLEEL